MMLAEVKDPSFTMDAAGVVSFSSQVMYLSPGSPRVIGEITVTVAGSDTQATLATKITTALDAEAATLGIASPTAVVMQSLVRIR